VAEDTIENNCDDSFLLFSVKIWLFWTFLTLHHKHNICTLSKNFNLFALTLKWGKKSLPQKLTFLPVSIASTNK
jgi:hypothetical protein